MEQLVQRLEGIRQILMAHHSAGALLPNASKGNERETLLREFLIKVFPPPFRFGSGAIVDQFRMHFRSAGCRCGVPVLPEFSHAGRSGASILSGISVVCR